MQLLYLQYVTCLCIIIGRFQTESIIQSATQTENDVYEKELQMHRTCLCCFQNRATSIQMHQGIQQVLDF